MVQVCITLRKYLNYSDEAVLLEIKDIFYNYI